MPWILVLVLLLGGCDRYRLTYDDPIRDAAIIRHNEILAAQVRRAQVIAEIARLNHVIRFTHNVENRIVLEDMLDLQRVELTRLNVVIGD